MTEVLLSITLQPDWRLRILIVGLGYFIANGLDLGLDYENWSGLNPGITKVTPRLD
jgi:hypothetical protein